MKNQHGENTIFNQIEDWWDSGFLGYLNPDEFPEVTFENSSQQVELKLLG